MKARIFYVKCMKPQELIMGFYAIDAGLFLCWPGRKSQLGAKGKEETRKNSAEEGA